jgi:methyl-accepting chemotaxis protein
MKTWQDWKIGTKFGVLFGMFLLILLALGGIGLSWLGRLNANTTAELQKRFTITKLTNDTIANSTDNARITMQLFETTDPEQEKRLNEENDVISHNIGVAVAEIEKSMSTQQERELFEVVTQNRNNYVSLRSKAKKLLLDKKHDQAMAALMGEVIPALTVYRAS